jgi:hypothetical protein
VVLVWTDPFGLRISPSRTTFGGTISRGDDRRRFALFLALTERGVTADDAGAAMHAVHPFDSDLRCDRALEKPVRKLARRLSKEIGRAPSAQVGPLAVEAMRSYRELAVATGDTTYTERFDEMLAKFASP